MNTDIEHMIEQRKPRMEAIVHLREGMVVRVESPDGTELAEADRSERLRAVVNMYQNWPHPVNARLFVYKNGRFGACME